jgi:2,4-dienoyl-CoA reductase-like NADH-dependent reductase (Old Yellow Enzyme family)
MTDLSHLFSPIEVGRCTIKNRILMSGHLTGYAELGLPSQRHARYYEARAKGGIGLIVMEAVPVSPHGYILPTAVAGWDDAIIPGLEKISDAVHAHGAKIFCQAWHNGCENSSYFSKIYSQSCSDVPSCAVGEVPTVMTEKDIRAAIRLYADFSLRLKKGGFDGVELHFAHGYLPQQFLSPYVNNRKDRYGGSLENRMRFGIELIEAVRNEVGTDFVVGLRISADELVPGGLTLEDMKEIAPFWDRTGQIDFLDVSIGNYKTIAPMIAPMMIPPGAFSYAAAEIRQQVDVPVFTAIRINDPVMANGIIENHEADMVVMTRATLCDPDMPNKAKADRIDDIRLCVGCNEGCWEQATRGMPITCAQNPEAGNEGNLQVLPADPVKKVVVVGGGVAGMEAAIMAKERGHSGVRFEKEPELGGALMIASTAPCRSDLAQVIRYRVHELDRLDVDVRLNTAATLEAIEKENPDVVIVAAGADTIESPDPDTVGIEASIDIEPGTHVVTAEDVLTGKVATGQKVVIADLQTYMKGLVTAEVLADQGKDVTVVMPYPIRGLAGNPYDMDGPTHTIQAINLTQKKVKRITDFAVKKAEPGSVFIRNHYTEEVETLKADTLVLSIWRKSRIKLFHELEGKVAELYRIGDCVSPRRYINAVEEGFKVGMQI